MSILIQPTQQPARYIVKRDDEIILDGITELGQATGVSNILTAIYAEGDAEFLAIAGDAGNYRPLPDVGEWLDAKDIYSLDGQFLIVRQSHRRTHHAPADVPALFSIHRPNQSNLDWIANEPVLVGTVRIYDGKKYRCIQAHTTQVDWIPPIVPALWQLTTVVEPPPPDEYPAWKPWDGHNASLYQVGDRVRHNSQNWESTTPNNHWRPGVFGWKVI